MLRTLFILLGALGVGDNLCHVVRIFQHEFRHGAPADPSWRAAAAHRHLFQAGLQRSSSSTVLGAWIKWALVAAYTAFFTLVADNVRALIYREGHASPPAGADAVIVLGCGVRGERVSLTLARRLDAALAYLEENPKAYVVVSGGQGAGEDISEAGGNAALPRCTWD